MKIPVIKHLLTLILFFTFTIPIPTVAEIFKWKDEKGKVHFTDDLSKIPQTRHDAIEKIPMAEEPTLERDSSLGTIDDLDSPPKKTADKIKVNTIFYDIEGTSMTRVIRQMDLLRPNIKGYKGKYSALTSWDVNWKYKYKTHHNRCIQFDVLLTATITYIMPRLVNYESVRPIVKRNWDKFYKAIQKHEDGHALHGKQALQEIERLAHLPLSKNTCLDVVKNFNSRAATIVKKYRQKDVKYDKKTNYGRNQGAAF